MSYSLARAQIVTIVETYAMAAESQRVGRASFKHYPDASDARLPKSRGFWLTAISHAMLGPYTPGLPQRHRSQMVLTVCYLASSDPSIDDVNMASDHRQISTQLLSPTNWNRPTSTLVTLSNGEDLLMPATIDNVDGARLLRLTFPMEYTS